MSEGRWPFVNMRMFLNHLTVYVKILNNFLTSVIRVVKLQMNSIKTSCNTLTISYTLIRGKYACLLVCAHNYLRDEPTNLAQTLEITNIRSKNYF
jgi:hypothetical protein